MKDAVEFFSYADPLVDELRRLDHHAFRDEVEEDPIDGGFVRSVRFKFSGGAYWVLFQYEGKVKVTASPIYSTVDILNYGGMRALCEFPKGLVSVETKVLHSSLDARYRVSSVYRLRS